jgi:hypothetical protein
MPSSFRAPIALLGLGAASIAAACSALIDLQDVPYRDEAGPVEAGGGEGGACPAGALSCQDFEEGGVSGPWRIDDNDGGAVVRVESADRHRGSFALAVTIAGSGVGSGVVQYLAPQSFASGARVFVRAWFRVQTRLVNASIIELRHDRRSLSGGVSLKLIDGKLSFNVTDRSLTQRGGAAGDAGPAVGVWECIRIGVDVGPVGRVTIFRGEEVVVDARGVDTLTGETGWEALWLGLPFADLSSGGAEVLVDDIVVANDTIPCTTD